jgi:hypothetical protein
MLKKVLLFYKEASGYFCVTVVSVYLIRLKEPPIYRDKKVL